MFLIGCVVVLLVGGGLCDDDSDGYCYIDRFRWSQVRYGVFGIRWLSGFGIRFDIGCDRR